VSVGRTCARANRQGRRKGQQGKGQHTHTHARRRQPARHSRAAARRRPCFCCRYQARPARVGVWARGSETALDKTNRKRTGLLKKTHMHIHTHMNTQTHTHTHTHKHTHTHTHTQTRTHTHTLSRTLSRTPASSMLLRISTKPSSGQRVRTGVP
jgi:hypothetical protein